MTSLARTPRCDVPPHVRALDRDDPLRLFRARFELPEGLIYLNGNSLGPLPAATTRHVTELIKREWGRDLVSSWNRNGWIEAPRRLGGKLAPLVGAAADEVLVADSTSVNLFKLLVAGCERQSGRSVILTEPGNFPTDLYLARASARLLPGRKVVTVPRERIVEELSSEVAVLLLTHVHYKSGRMYDMAAVNAAAHAAGALVLWDLSHSAGAVRLDLSGCSADLAVGCGYKFLNGGPGAPAFLYAAKRLQEDLGSPLAGWMGHAAPFAFDDDYVPAPGIDRFLCGTPPIIAMAALEAALDLWGEVDRDVLFSKGQEMADLFIKTVEEFCPGSGLELVTPRCASARGSHVSFAHASAYAISRALSARGVVVDFRAPNVIRFAMTPLYTRYEELWAAAAALSEVLHGREWDSERFRTQMRVT